MGLSAHNFSASSGLPTQMSYQRLQPWDLFSRETSFHSTTACLTASPNRNSTGVSHGRCRHLTPGDTGRADKVSGTPARRNHHQQLTHSCLLGSSSHSPWDFSPPQCMTYIYSVFICANIYLRILFFFFSSPTFAIPPWIMHLTEERNAVSSILPVGCAYRPWPAARRGSDQHHCNSHSSVSHG